MDTYEWIMYAGAAVWIGLGLYVFALARRQSVLSRRIDRMSALLEDDHGAR